MVTAHQYLDALIDPRLALNAINEPMLPCDPARPPTRQFPFQSLRLTQALEGIPARILDQRIDPDQDRWVILEPMLIIVPSVGAKMHPHDLGGT